MIHGNATEWKVGEKFVFYHGGWISTRAGERMGVATGGEMPGEIMTIAR